MRCWAKRVAPDGLIAITNNRIVCESAMSDWTGPVEIPDNLYEAVQRAQDIAEGMLQAVESRER